MTNPSCSSFNLQTYPSTVEVISYNNEKTHLPLEVIFKVFGQYLSPPPKPPLLISSQDLITMDLMQKKLLLDFVEFLHQQLNDYERVDEIKELIENIQQELNASKVSLPSKNTSMSMLFIKGYLLKYKSKITEVLKHLDATTLHFLEEKFDERFLTFPAYYQNIFIMPALVNKIALIDQESDVEIKKQKYTELFNHIFKFNEDRVYNIEYSTTAIAMFFSIKEKGTQKIFRTKLLNYLEDIGEHAAAKKLAEDIAKHMNHKTLKHIKASPFSKK